MKVGIDVDQVLANFGWAFVDYARSKGFDTPWPIPSWEFGLKKEDMKHLLNDVYTKGPENGFWANLGVLLTNEEMFSLHNVCRDNEVYFITSRPWKGSQQITAKWLQEKLGVPRPSVVVSESKQDVAAVLGLDRHLDDNVPTVMSIALETDTKAYLLKTTYSEAFPEYKYVHDTENKIIIVKTVAEYLQSVI